MLRNKQLVFFFLILFCTFIDQFFKLVVNSNVQLNQEKILLQGILSIEKVYNTGAAFSILEYNTFVLIIVSILTLVFIILFVFRQMNKLNFFEIIALALVSGGAVGNLIDRLVFSYVIDFLQLKFISFPIFNFADIFINVGVIMLIVNLFVLKNDK